MEKKNSLYKYACRMTSIKRFAALKLDREYSTATHSFRVAILAMMIADNYNRLNPSAPVNIEETLRKALLHDLEEAYIGDIPTPAKKLLPEFSDAYEKLAEKVMKEEILTSCPEPEYYFELWKNQKSGASGEIIKLADTLEALCTTFYELKRGNVVISKAHRKFIEWFESDLGEKLLTKYPLARDMYLNNKFDPHFLEKLKLVPSSCPEDEDAA